MRDALVVAISDYQHRSLRRLSTPSVDAEQWSAVLRDQRVGDFGRVKVLHNPSVNEFSDALERLFRDPTRVSSDTVLFYFSGHGVKDADGRLFLATGHTDPDLLLSSSVPAGFVHELMQRSPARTQVVILDCCFAGAFDRDLVKGGPEVGLRDQLPPSKGRVILAGSSAIEFSFEGDSGRDANRPSVFTEALVNGLRTGAADLDGDGLITVDELFTYASDQLAASAARQRPVKFAIAQDGQIPLARNPYGVRQKSLDRPVVPGDAEFDIALQPPPPPRRVPRITLVAIILAVIAVIMSALALITDSSKAPEYVEVQPGATTTTLGSPASTTPGATTASTTTTIVPSNRAYPSVVGKSYSDARKTLEDNGWKVEPTPARVASTISYAIVSQRLSSANDAVTLIVADTPTCDKEPEKWTYCDGRPVAHYKWAAPSIVGTTLKVGTRLELTDVSGNASERRWRWSQGGASGYFTETTASLVINVGGKAGDPLTITLESTNSKGSDKYALTWQVA